MYRPRGRNLLHLASYATPETVTYIFTRPGVASLVNQPDHYNDGDQLGVYYHTASQQWKVVKIDRNRMEHRWMVVGHPEELRSLVSILFAGQGSEMDAESFGELAKAKSDYRAEKPDRYPLHAAIEAGNPEVAEVLLRNGADVDNRDGFGMTALHTAAKCGDERVIELLCNSGADCTLLDNTNSTALRVAQDNGHQHLAELL